MSAALARPEDIPADQTLVYNHVAGVGGDPNSEPTKTPTAPIACSSVRPNVPADPADRDASGGTVGGDPNIRSGQSALESHSGCAAAEQSPHPASALASPNAAAPGGAPNGDGHTTAGTQTGRAVAPTSPDPAKVPVAPILPPAGPGTLTPEQAKGAAYAIEPLPARAPLPPAPTIGEPPSMPGASVLAETNRPRGPAIEVTTTIVPSLSLADPLLALAADVLDDLERVRVANENRLRQLTRSEEDSDGELRGFGFPADFPEVVRFAAVVEALAASEHQAQLNLKRILRKHPLGPWVGRTVGVGEKQAARLFAAIGDPYWNAKYDRPRTVSELRSYCGWGDARAQVRRKGQKNRWSDTAKKRAWVIAQSCVKQLRKPCHKPDGRSWAEHVDGCACSPYRLVYDDCRRKYAGTVHDIECVRCGPSGAPAQPGSPRAPGHQEAMAYRAVAKEVLKDLWREAKRIHQQHDPD